MLVHSINKNYFQNVVENIFYSVKTLSYNKKIILIVTLALSVLTACYYLFRPSLNRIRNFVNLYYINNPGQINDRYTESWSDRQRIKKRIEISFEPKPRNQPIPPLYNDLIIYIATYLSDIDKIRLGETSRSALDIIDSPVLWNEHLKDKRIWGATSVPFTYDPKRGWISNLEAVQRNCPLTQLQIYNKLLKINYEIDYFVRLIPGGPVRFFQIPYLEKQDLSTLSPEKLTKSIARGTDRLGNPFLAFKVIDTAAPIPKPDLLIFVYHLSSGPGGEMVYPQAGWNQLPNSIWTIGKLKLSRQNTLSYLLALTHSEDLSHRDEFSAEPYKTTIKLC